MNLNTVRHDVFSVEQLSSTVSEVGKNFISDKRLGQSFYNMIRLTGPSNGATPAVFSRLSLRINQPCSWEHLVFWQSVRNASFRLVV